MTRPDHARARRAGCCCWPTPAGRDAREVPSAFVEAPERATTSGCGLLADEAAALGLRPGRCSRSPTTRPTRRATASWRW